MRRRSFFGVVFGALAATRLSRGKSKGGVCPREVPRHGSPYGDDGGTTAPSYGGQPRGFVSYPVSGGSYQPGDTFSIGRRRVITKID